MSFIFLQTQQLVEIPPLGECDQQLPTCLSLRYFRNVDSDGNVGTNFHTQVPACFKQPLSPSFCEWTTLRCSALHHSLSVDQHRLFILQEKPSSWLALNHRNFAFHKTCARCCHKSVLMTDRRFVLNFASEALLGMCTAKSERKNM